MNCTRKSLTFMSTEHSTTLVKLPHGKEFVRMAGTTTASCGAWCWRMRAACRRDWTRSGSQAAATSAEHPWACSRAVEDYGSLITHRRDLVLPIEQQGVHFACRMRSMEALGCWV